MRNKHQREASPRLFYGTRPEDQARVDWYVFYPYQLRIVAYHARYHVDTGWKDHELSRRFPEVVSQNFNNEWVVESRTWLDFQSPELRSREWEFVSRLTGWSSLYEEYKNVDCHYDPCDARVRAEHFLHDQLAYHWSMLARWRRMLEVPDIRQESLTSVLLLPGEIELGNVLVVQSRMPDGTAVTSFELHAED